jgi:hypothetical protein
MGLQLLEHRQFFLGHHLNFLIIPEECPLFFFLKEHVGEFEDPQFYRIMDEVFERYAIDHTEETFLDERPF